jgi:YcaO cyclodehydratase, ATP-ad Mg2+-binding
MRPELVVEREPWAVSHDEARTTALLTSRTRSVLVRGAAAQRAISAPQEVVATPLRRVLAWDADPRVCADVELADVGVWSSTGELRTMLAAPPARHTYVVCARRPTALIEALADAPLAAPVTPVVVYGGRALIGPTFRDETWPCRACWIRALCANVPSLAQRAARGHVMVMSAGFDAGRVLAAARALWEAPAARRPPDAALVLGLDDGTVAHQRLFPVPGCACASHGPGSAPPGRLEDAVGDLLGRFTAVGDADREAPLAIRTAVSRINDAAAGGACAADPAIATRRALAEAAERFAASHAEHAYERAAHCTLPSAAKLHDLLPFSDLQYATPGFAYARLVNDEPIDWIIGRDWRTERAVHLPASIVTLDPRCSGPRFAPRRSTGLAAGPSEPAAALSGLFEVVERDVVVRGWYRGAASTLDPDVWAPFETRRLSDAGLRVRLAICPNRLAAPVTVAFVGTRDRGALGCSAGPTLAHAAIHAIEEAALMFSHRRQRKCLLAARDAWRVRGAVGDDELRRHAAVDLQRLVDHYRPVIVSLSTRDTACMGVCVARVWSARAVDFVGPDEALPLRRWRPGAAMQELIAKLPPLFASEAADGDGRTNHAA